MPEGLDADEGIEEKDTAEGEMNELDGLDPWFGRLGGGGAGALPRLSLKLDDRDRMDSSDDLAGGAGPAASSSAPPRKGGVAGLVSLPLPSLRGGGGGLLGGAGCGGDRVRGVRRRRGPRGRDGLVVGIRVCVGLGYLAGGLAVEDALDVAVHGAAGGRSWQRLV